MQKNDKSYTFLFSHSSKSKIYIKQGRGFEEASAKYFIRSRFNYRIYIHSEQVYSEFSIRILHKLPFWQPSLENQTVNQLSLKPNQVQTIDYSRPETSDDLRTSTAAALSDDRGYGRRRRRARERSFARSRRPAIRRLCRRCGRIWARSITNSAFDAIRFGGRTYEFHAGMDIDGERGDLVVAPANGSRHRSRLEGRLRQYDRDRPRQRPDHALRPPFEDRGRASATRSRAAS